MAEEQSKEADCLMAGGPHRGPDSGVPPHLHLHFTQRQYFSRARTVTPGKIAHYGRQHAWAHAVYRGHTRCSCQRVGGEADQQGNGQYSQEVQRYHQETRPILSLSWVLMYPLKMGIWTATRRKSELLVDVMLLLQLKQRKICREDRLYLHPGIQSGRRPHGGC